jgi:hypothetical protein
MTAQFGEKLIYEGRSVTMHSNPLEDYFEAKGKRPKFDSICTACWRGYVGTWEIKDDRLYLIGFRGFGKLIDGTEASLQTIFPDQDGPILADWYSGTLKIPEGEMLEYIHAGYASRFERDRFFEIDKGVVVRTYVRDNTPTSGQ